MLGNERREEFYVFFTANISHTYILNDEQVLEYTFYYTIITGLLPTTISLGRKIV